MNLEQLRARLAELHEKTVNIQNKADGEQRELNAAEVTELDALMVEFDVVESDIARRVRIENMSARAGAPAGRQVAPNPIAAATIANPRVVDEPQRSGLQNSVLPSNAQRQRWDFTSFGEYCQQVRNAVVNPGHTDQRLLRNAALSTFGSEGVGADGGFAVPPEWRSEIMQMVDSPESLLPRTDQQRVSGNSTAFPVDESTAWQTTGGIQAYWDGESDTINQSKPQLKDLGIKLHRLTALIPVTEELLEDAPAMSGYVTRKAGEKMNFKITDAIINGTGAGMPLGVMNSPAKVAVTKETSQVAATIHADNVVKMMARLPSGSYSRAVWLANQDCLPQIMKLGFVVTNAAGTAAGGAGAIWLPPNGLANSSPYGNLLGRPIIITEACQTVGAEGDLILADLSMYLSAVKGSLRSDVSMHLWFDQNTTAFRFIMRMNGQPWLSKPITRKNGSNTLSHFVTLAVRA